MEEEKQWCNKCNGKGVLDAVPFAGGYVGSIHCSKCLGEGKLDWIEMATGKKLYDPPQYSKLWKKYSQTDNEGTND